MNLRGSNSAMRNKLLKVEEMDDGSSRDVCGFVVYSSTRLC